VIVGQAKLSLQPNTVFGQERHGLHVCDDARVKEMRQLHGTAFTIRDPLPWTDVAGIASEGEGLRYVAVFLPETGARDTVATLAAIAGETERLLLGTGVIPMGARTSRLAAMAAATVQERSGGRHILGVGTGGTAPGALGRLRDYVQELRELVSGSAPGAALRLPLPAPVPIWTAALGPRAVRLAGQIADGVILNWCTPDRVA
jgi:alkanesulfonate monooxygenase SsuD/methylene tetrahydromethanopterin reductase-like flavin-dependent oxidoreductase (luciferase family)